MTKANNKTQPTKESAASYIKGLSDAKAQSDAKILVKVFKEATGMKPVMWGNIVGFGEYHYVYPSGREGDMLASGFAMRQSGPVLYIMPGYQDYSAMLEKIGVKYKLGKACLYLKNTDGLNVAALKKLIKMGLKDLNKMYPVSRT